MKKYLEAPYLYAFLVFIGFYNHFIYYRFFEIEISAFLTPGELLLSFLPLTFPILILFTVAVFFFVTAIFQHRSDEAKSSAEPEGEPTGYNILNIRYLINEIGKTIKLGKWKSRQTYFDLMLFLFWILLGIASYCFLFFYFLHFEDRLFGSKTFFTLTSSELMLTGILWLFLIDIIIVKGLKGLDKAIYITRTILILLFAIGVLSIHNRDTADAVLRGNPVYLVKFYVDEQDVQTDANLVFIGLTDKYLFLRDISKKKNLIYSRDGIHLIEMIKLREVPAK